MENVNTMKYLVLAFLENIQDDYIEKRIIEAIDKISPDPEWLDYLFYDKAYINADGNVDINRFLEKVFSYKKILL